MTTSDMSFERTIYQYNNPDGSQYCEVTRIDKPNEKEFLVQPSGLKGPHPLYRAERLVALPTETRIVIVEGEKAVHCAESVGLSAVTSKGGSGAAHKTDWAPLAPFPNICILPDRDEPGAKYAQEIIGILNRLPGSRRVTICDLPGLEGAGDIVDFMKDHTVEELMCAIEEHGRPAKWEPVATVATVASDEALPSLLKDVPEADSYPVDALGDDLGGVVRAIAEFTVVPEALAAQSILSAVALAVQKHANLCLDGRISPASLFCMTVAQTGDRKTAVDSIALAPHRAWQDEEFLEYQSALQDFKREMYAYNFALKRIDKGKDRRDIAQKIKDLGDPPDTPMAPSLLISNMTSEGLHRQLNEGLPYSGVFTDEGGSLIGGYAMSKENLLHTLTDFSSLWGISNELRVRAGNGLTSTRGKRLSMHVMAQPEVAAILFGKRIAHRQGFLPRVLVTAPRTLRGTRMYRRGDLTSLPGIREYNRRIRHILERHAEYLNGRKDCLNPRNVSLSPDAFELWVEFHNKIEEQNAPDGPLDCISGWASKAAEHAARIALVLSLYEDLDCSAISIEHMKNGIGLAEFYLVEMYRVHAQGEHDEEVLAADQLLRFMRENAVKNDKLFTSKYLLQNGPNCIRDAVSLRDALELLKVLGEVESAPGKGKKWRLK